MDDGSSEELLIMKVGDEQKFSIYLGFQIFFPILGGFLFGYDTGVISGAILLIRKYFNLTTFLQETVVSATILSCAVSSLLSGILSEMIGRRKSLIFSSIMLIFGSLVMGLARSVVILIIGRIIVGIGVGVAATCCPIYISEVAPEQIRGRLVLLYNLSITAGELIAAFVDALFYKLGPEGWRYMLGVAMFPALVQFIGLLFIPESHRWLISKNRIDEARNIIKKENRIKEDLVEEYIENIVRSHAETSLRIKQHQMNDRSLICQIFNDKVARKTLFIGCFLQMFQQIVGINTVMYYSASVIRMAGISNIQNILWLAVLVAFFNFLPSFIGFLLIDRIGRRKLILFSLIGIFFSLILLASTFQVLTVQSDLVQYHDPTLTSSEDLFCSFKHNCEGCITSQTCGFCYIPSATNKEIVMNSTCLASKKRFSDYSDNGWCSNKTTQSILPKPQWLRDYCLSKYSWLIILGMIIYLTFFSLGMGPVPWTITSEIYPLWCRGTNMAISTSTNWTFNLIISLTFLTLTEVITKYGTFWLFSSFALCGIIFIYLFLPETNQKTLEEITVLIENK